MAKAGSSFTGWTLAADGSGVVYKFGFLNLIIARKNIIFYARWGYPLTIAIQGDGQVASDDGQISVSGDGNSGTGTYSFNETIPVTATPNAGSVFDRWSGDCSGSNNPLAILMNGSKICTAEFSV